MKIHVYHHPDFETNKKLDHILCLLRIIQQEEQKMAIDLTNLTAEVDRAVTVAEGVEKILAYVVSLLEANKTDPAAIQAIADKLKAGTDGLAEAAANVPPEDQPPV